MKKPFFIFCSLTFFTFLFPYAQNHYWQQQADFNINVSLNDVKHTLDATETITYTNHSPDTLHFIWFHLWPNAYKNDKTAFSEQMVERLDNSEFYYSDEKDKGYINKLDFKVDGQTALLLDDSLYIDVAKLLLTKPLPPEGQVTITTSFHVKLPKNFSRGGHIDQSYQITQWYPKPAVYDRFGWHPMPYLDQGEFYSEFGNYEVAITLPKNYVVAATGQLQDTSEKEFIESRKNFNFHPKIEKTQKDIFAKKINTEDAFPISSSTQKTLHYKANTVIDFAWFADKRFIVQHDTLSLPTNPKIDAYTFILPSKKEDWATSADWVKRAVQFYSQQLGDYPYPTVSAVCGPSNVAEGGMEYPNVTLVNIHSGKQNLDLTLAHEVGHNWLQGMIATNERNHAWMDEGINTYYENKYKQRYYPVDENNKYAAREATDPVLRLLASQIAIHKDQPIETTSEDFTFNNYTAVVYGKGSLFMAKLQKELGKDTMLSVMHTYFDEWHFRHPYPADLQKTAEEVSGKNLDSTFRLLYKTGLLDSSETEVPHKITGPIPRFDGKAKYTTITPAVAYNNYDQTMVGITVSNIDVPMPKFHYMVAPLYATGSKQFNYIGAAAYTFYPHKKLQSITPAISFAKFSTDDGQAQDYSNLYKGFSKIVPSLRFVFKQKSPTSNIEKWIEIKSFLITEGTFAEYKQRSLPQDTFSYYPTKFPKVFRSVNQLSFNVENSRHLYPYKLLAQLQQTGDIVRATVTGNYFFNYNAKKQGINIRLFAGKIFYTKTSTLQTRAANDRYAFTMYGANGSDDYTYSNPFVERNQSTAFAGKQIMIKDGGFKYRSDYSGEKPGRSDNWLAATNFTLDIPRQINPLAVLPFNIPIKIFADIGTSADAWIENSAAPKFLYSTGLQLPILKYINIYWTVFQSTVFDEPNSSNGLKWWQKNVTFSIDIQNIKSQVAGFPLW